MRPNRPSGDLLDSERSSGGETPLLPVLDDLGSDAQGVRGSRLAAAEVFEESLVEAHAPILNTMFSQSQHGVSQHSVYPAYHHSMEEEKNYPVGPMLERMAALGIKQVDLATRLNVSEQVITNWKSRGIPKSRLFEIASALEITGEEYLELARPAPGRSKSAAPRFSRTRRPDAADGELPEGKYLFPRAYADVVAGLGRGRFNADFHVEVEGTMPVPRDLIAARGWNIARLAVVNTEGPSMYPTINDGEPVLINLDDVKIVSGRVYAIESPDEGLRIKRLYRESDGRILVRSDNPDKLVFRDEWLTPDSQARVVGRVVYRTGEL